MDATKLSLTFAALSNEVRLRILDLVSARKQMCVCELVDELRMSQANISWHVGILRNAGLLHARKIGTWVFLSVDEQPIESAARQVCDMVRANHRGSAHEDPQARLAQRCVAA